MTSGWKKIVIDGNAELHRSDNCLLIIKDSEVRKIPVNQVSVLVIESEQVTLTSSLIIFLVENNVSVIFCDNKHNPCLEALSFNGNAFSSERLNEQIKWKEERKLEMGCGILRLKIQNQSNLLKRLGISDFVYLEALLNSIDSENAMIIEAEAAKVYFHGLFGRDFQRRTESSINSALNYGYAILLSAINRIVISHGYNTNLGLNHHSNRNHFNFSCDLIEPFRPFVDRFAFENSNYDFDRNYKKRLLSIYTNEIRYNKSIVSLETALELFALAIIKRMTDTLKLEEVIDFA